MRKITELASKAFWNNDYFKRDNTTVHNGIMTLHRTIIAKQVNGVLTIDTDGYLTNTTKERLNGVLMSIGWKIYQKDFKWYLYNFTTKETIPYQDNIKLKLGA